MNKSQLIIYLMQTNLFFYSYKAGDEVPCHHFQRCLGFGLVFPPHLLARCYWEAGLARGVAGPRTCAPPRWHSAEPRPRCSFTGRQGSYVSWQRGMLCPRGWANISAESEQTFPIDEDRRALARGASCLAIYLPFPCCRMTDGWLDRQPL